MILGIGELTDKQKDFYLRSYRHQEKLEADLKAWGVLPFWKRWITRRPQEPNVWIQVDSELTCLIYGLIGKEDLA